MTRYSAAVVGLGNIGMRLDLGAGNDRVATHARAFTIHPGYELTAGIDPDARARHVFEQQYHLPAFSDLAAMQAAGVRAGIYSIAVPTPLHSKAFAEVLAQKPRAILCEKPLAEAVLDAERMLTDADASGCIVGVNYMRRFEPGVLTVRRLIAEGALGEIYKGTAWYSKGLLNNGSHVVDLLMFLLGKVADVRVWQSGRVWQGVDPEPDLSLRIGEARIVLLAAREECFSYMGLELVGTEGVLRYLDGGHRIELRRPRTDASLSGYRVLAPEAEMIQTDLKRYQWHVVDALHRCVEGGAPLLSSGATALETLRVIEQVHAALVSPLEHRRHHD